MEVQEGRGGGRKGRAWIQLHVQILEFFKCYLYFKQCLVQYITSNQIAMEFMQYVLILGIVMCQI